MNQDRGLNFCQNLFAFPTTDVLDWNTRCFCNDVVGKDFVIKVVCDFKSLRVLTIQERSLFCIKNISHTVKFGQKNLFGVPCQRNVFDNIFVNRGSLLWKKTTMKNRKKNIL